jgi:hypothetical protein
MGKSVEAVDVDPVSTLAVDFGEGEIDVDLSTAAQYASERRAQEDSLLGAQDDSDRNDDDDTV